MVFHLSVAGPDFDGTSPLHHTFLDGSSPGDRVYFDIQINNDEIVEANEYFAVSLFDPDQILEIHIDTANVHIKDDDSKQTPGPSSIMSYTDSLRVSILL